MENLDIIIKNQKAVLDGAAKLMGIPTLAELLRGNSPVLMDEPDRLENDNEAAPRQLEPLFGENDIEESGERSQTESEAFRHSHS